MTGSGRSASRRPRTQRRRAWSRSAQRSSTSSMPTESRIRFSGTVGGSPGSGGAARSATRRRRGWSRAPTAGAARRDPRRRPRAPPRTSIDDDARRSRGSGPARRAGWAASRRASSAALAWPARPAGAGCAARAAPARPPSARRSRRAGAVRAAAARAVGAGRRRAGVTGGAEHTSEWPDEVLGDRVHDDVGAELSGRCSRGVAKVLSTTTSAPLLVRGRDERRAGRRPRAAGWSATRARAGRPRRRAATTGVGVGDVDPPHRQPSARPRGREQAATVPL